MPAAKIRRLAIFINLSLAVAVVAAWRAGPAAAGPADSPTAPAPRPAPPLSMDRASAP